jgi:hypothetical protein
VDLVGGTVAEKPAFEKLHLNFVILLMIVSSKERLLFLSVWLMFMLLNSYALRPI